MTSSSVYTNLAKLLLLGALVKKRVDENSIVGRMRFHRHDNPLTFLGCIVVEYYDVTLFRLLSAGASLGLRNIVCVFWRRRVYGVVGVNKFVGVGIWVQVLVTYRIIITFSIFLIAFVVLRIGLFLIRVVFEVLVFRIAFVVFEVLVFRIAFLS